MNKIAQIFIILSAIAFICTSNVIMSITISLLLAALGIGMSILINIKRIKFKGMFKRIFLITIIFCTWAFIVYLINGQLKSSYSRIIEILAGIFITMSIYLNINSTKSINTLIKAMILASTISAIIGIGQVLIGQPFYSIWMSMNKNLRSDIITYTIYSKRAAGLSLYTIPFSYVMCAIIPINYGLIVFNDKFKNNKLIIYSSFFIMAFALILTQTRGAILGASIGCFFILFTKKEKKPNLFKMILAIISGLFLYGILGNYLDEGRYIDLSGGSAQSRIPMILTAINYSMKYPLGTGNYIPNEDDIPVDIINSEVVNNILNNTTHNSFINVLVYYGIPGILIVFIFYKTLYRYYKNNIKICTKYNLNELRSFQISLMGGIIGYTINSLTHNAGPFTGDIILWYVFGILSTIDKRIIMLNKEK